jgi:hypothetical protein
MKIEDKICSNNHCTIADLFENSVRFKQTLYAICYSTSSCRVFLYIWQVKLQVCSYKWVLVQIKGDKFILTWLVINLLITWRWLFRVLTYFSDFYNSILWLLQKLNFIKIRNYAIIKTLFLSFHPFMQFFDKWETDFN